MTQNSRPNTIIKTRKKIAEICSGASEAELSGLYAGEFGAVYKALLAQLAIENPCIQRERKPAEKLLTRLRKQATTENLLAAMLYHRAYDLRTFPDIRKIPRWFLQDFVRYMGCPIYMFHTTAETQRHVAHMNRWIDCLHGIITCRANTDYSSLLARLFLSETDFGPLYFSDSNLKGLYEKRGDIIEYALKMDGRKIDYAFQDRAAGNYPIRIGVIANHFAPHPETFAGLPVYEHLDTDFSTILYTFSLSNSEIERYCSSRASALKLLPAALDDQVKLIREDDLDIAFFATNITSSVSPLCVLAAHRLARIQIAGVGSVTTTGLGNIDYYMTGKLSDEPGNAAHYTEKLTWLPGTAHCFSYGPPLHQARTPINRQELGIALETIVYVSGANMLKISPALLDAWAAILKSVPDSILLLFPYGPNWASSYPKEAFVERLHKTLEANKVAVHRVLILDPQPTPTRDDIKEYLRNSDVYLDSFPFSGTTSFIEPLEIGLPVVTMQGQPFRTRMGGGLLKALDMNSLVGESVTDYIRIAVNLGQNTAQRNEIKERIRNAISAGPEFLDSKRYSNNVAELLRHIINPG